MCRLFWYYKFTNILNNYCLFTGIGFRTGMFFWGRQLAEIIFNRNYQELFMNYLALRFGGNGNGRFFT